MNALFEELKAQEKSMISLVETWANINSASENLPGLDKMLQVLKDAFSKLKGTISTPSLAPRKKINSDGELVTIPIGRALHITKHPNADIKLFLGGHMDTVYLPTSPFQKTTWLSDNTLKGPGVTDMKGGLVVMLKALEYLESSPFSGKIGWEILISPDEEIGSPGSAELIVQAAKRNHLGLIFEPSFPDGKIVSRRKGSSNFTIVVKGKAAHAGRDFAAGRNAITSLARIIIAAEKLTDIEKGITVNVGRIEGGGPVNIVPDLAIGHINTRVSTLEDQHYIGKRLHELVNEANRNGITAILHEHEARPPKLIDPKTQFLFQLMQQSANDLTLSLDWKPSGGVCDGNILSAEGLPNLDTLGVVGGNIHTLDEYLYIPSLLERTVLVVHFLMNLQGNLQSWKEASSADI
jgi:glutamate carboxypeptidase